MRIRRFFGAVALALALPGCITSEQGICPPDGGDQAIFDAAILGDWMLDGETVSRAKDGLKIDLGGKPLRLARLGEGSKAYSIGTPVKPGEAGDAPPDVGHLVPIGGARFLDVLVVNPKAKDQRIHHLIKVSSTPETLTFQFMDPGYFWSHPVGPGGAAKASISGRLPLGRGLSPEFSLEFPTLTAPTADLRRFLEEHANDPDLWPASWTIRLRRHPGESPSPQPPRTLALILSDDGSIRLDGQPITPAELPAALQARAGGSPPRLVIITASEVALGTLEPIVAAARAAGVRSIQFQLAGPSPKP